MQSSYLDKFAVALSGLCLIHCAAVPILVLSGPLLAGSLLTSEAFHGVLLAVILPTSTLALWLGFRSHGRLPLLMTGVGAMAVLTAARRPISRGPRPSQRRNRAHCPGRASCSPPSMWATIDSSP